MHLQTKGFEHSAAALATYIRRRYKLDRVLLFEHPFHSSGSCPASRRTSRASSRRISTASAVEKDKSMPLYDYKIHPVEPPSPGTVALAFLNATQPQISRHAHQHMSFARPPALRSLPRRLRVRFVSIPTSLSGVLRRPHVANPTRLSQARVSSLVWLQPIPQFLPPTQIQLTAERVGRVSSRALVFL